MFPFNAKHKSVMIRIIKWVCQVTLNFKTAPLNVIVFCCDIMQNPPVCIPLFSMDTKALAVESDESNYFRFSQQHLPFSKLFPHTDHYSDNINKFIGKMWASNYVSSVHLYTDYVFSQRARHFFFHFFYVSVKNFFYSFFLALLPGQWREKCGSYRVLKRTEWDDKYSRIRSPPLWKEKRSMKI